jgi:hypothetical protein
MVFGMNKKLSEIMLTGILGALIALFYGETLSLSGVTQGIPKILALFSVILLIIILLMYEIGRGEKGVTVNGN